jgi:hypothetical protein
MKMFGQESAGQSKKAEYEYKSAMALRNSQIMRDNAGETLTAYGKKAEISGRRTGFQIANQKVAQAGSGFDVNTGSAAEVRQSTSDVGMEDQSTILREGDVKALGQRNAAGGYEAEAAADRRAGNNAVSAARFSEASTLLEGAGSVAGKWYQASDAFPKQNPYYAPLDYNG